MEMGVDTTRGGCFLTMTAPEMAKLYLLIKVHKDGYPERPVVSQIDDPTYNICKVLTDILNPLVEGGAFLRQKLFWAEEDAQGGEVEQELQAGLFLREGAVSFHSSEEGFGGGEAEARGG